MLSSHADTELPVPPRCKMFHSTQGSIREGTLFGGTLGASLYQYERGPEGASALPEVTQQGSCSRRIPESQAHHLSAGLTERLC